MKKILFTLVVSLVVAAPATASGFKGTVVARGAGSLAVATPSGAVQSVRSASSARVGSVVRVSGTHVTVVGRSHHARIHGIVVHRAGSVRFIAAGHALMAVRTRRSLASVGAAPSPTPGTVVDEEVQIDQQGNLDEQSSKSVGQAATTSVSATVTSVGTGTITLSVNGQSLTLPLPAGLVLPANVVGSTVGLTLNLGGANGATAQPDENNQNDDGDQNDDNGDNSNSDTGSQGNHND